MLTTLREEKGTALVAALFFITALAVTATVIVWVTGSERRVSFNEYTHSRSFYASDAGSERAINWVRTQDFAPPLLDTESRQVFSLNDYIPLHDDHKFRYDIVFDRVRFRPGWTKEYLDFDYTIDSRGASVQESSTRLEVRVSRLFLQGY
jgi:hypothetical protein